MGLVLHPRPLTAGGEASFTAWPKPLARVASTEWLAAGGAAHASFVETFESLMRPAPPLVQSPLNRSPPVCVTTPPLTVIVPVCVVASARLTTGVLSKTHGSIPVPPGW